MDAEERGRLEAKGFRIGTVAEFLSLSPGEPAVVDMRIALARNLREQRLTRGVQQADLAAKARTTQKRISLMENGDKSILIDRLFAANVELGICPGELLKQLSESLQEPYADYSEATTISVRKRVAKRKVATG